MLSIKILKKILVES